MKMAFLSGAVVGALLFGAAGMFRNPGQQHVREEVKMAFSNRALAIERGDRLMQTYFEDSIAWNALMYPEPSFYRGVYQIDWLGQPAEEPTYRRSKDGISRAAMQQMLMDSGTTTSR